MSERVASFEPDKILAVLARHGVDYVMIGGLAAVLHGSNLATTDMDITPALGDENLTRLSRALTELGARVRTVDVPSGVAFQHDARSLGAVSIWKLTTNSGDLDISFVPSGTQGFADL